MSLILIFLLCLALGSVAGVIAGLFGVGGGLIIVPALVALFHALGFSEVILVQLAVGTSLATIILTSISSVRAHHQRGSLDVDWLKRLVPGILIGAWVGSWVASQMQGDHLALVIGTFACGVAIHMARSKPPAQGQREPNPYIASAGGLGIGGISALFGIGGGTLTVPFLSAHRMVIQRAVGTSSACGLPIAVSGALSAMVQGVGKPELPEMAFGFVYLPAFAGIVLTSVPFARVGARLAHYFSQQVLKRLFALLLFCVGLQFVLRTLLT